MFGFLRFALEFCKKVMGISKIGVSNCERITSDRCEIRDTESRLLMLIFSLLVIWINNWRRGGDIFLWNFHILKLWEVQTRIIFFFEIDCKNDAFPWDLAWLMRGSCDWTIYKFEWASLAKIINDFFCRRLEDVKNFINFLFVPLRIMSRSLKRILHTSLFRSEGIALL